MSAGDSQVTVTMTGYLSGKLSIRQSGDSQPTVSAEVWINGAGDCA